jgi:trigger factor
LTNRNTNGKPAAIMDVQVEKTGPCACKLVVKIPAQEVDRAFDSAYKAVARQAAVPGYRAGKAPRNIIESQYASQIYNEVENKLVKETLQRAIDESKVVPVTMPQVEVGHLKKGTEFNYSALVETQPEITLTRYQGLEATKFPVTLTDEDVSKELENLRHRASQIVPVKDRKTLEKGDLVVVDYVSTPEMKPSEPQTPNAILEVGTGNLALLTTQLIGKEVPSTCDLSATFPVEHPVHAWAGKTVRFELTLKEIKQRWMPPLDDALAEDLGEKSLEDLTTKVRTQLSERRQQEAESKERHSVLKSLVAANPFDVPRSLVLAQADRMVQNVTERVGRMMGKQLQMSPQELQNLRDSSTEEAEFNVRSALLLIEVAKAAEIKCDDNDLKQEIDHLISLNPHVEVSKLREYFNEKKRYEEIRYRIVENKTVKYLLENAVYVAS